MKLERSATTLSIASFHEQNQLNKFNFEPPYQRRSVWSDEKQSYFIDSILRNFPIPPIFLHRKIDTNTGRTSFDVIDGKQRLTAIARFIGNEIPAANEYGPAEAVDEFDGVYFQDLSSSSVLSELKAEFWKYNLPIEYIDPSDQGLIEDVFDRLNRNGEPLRGQELRNAQYHASPLMAAVNMLLENVYMRTRVAVTDLARMEDKEFCSECLLSVLVGQVIGSSQSILDQLYEAHSTADFTATVQSALEMCADLDSLGLDYAGLKITGVSHLYGLWSLALVLRSKNRKVGEFKTEIHSFYQALRDGTAVNLPVRDEYKRSMNSRTKERFMRVRRVNALLAACGQEALVIK
jgi:hypothetical protein